MNRRLSESGKEYEFHQLSLSNIHDQKRLFHEEASGLYSYMFIDDVETHCILYGVESYSKGKSFGVNLSNSSLETEVKVLFHTLYGYDPALQRLSESVYRFIRNVALLLLYKGGKVLFEIVKGTIKENDVVISAYILEPINGKVYKFGRNYYQLIPKSERRSGKSFVVVPNSKVWKLSIPSQLGSPRSIRTLSDNLRELGKATFVGYDIVRQQQEYFGFDSSSFRSQIDATVLRATQNWGWDMRMGLGNQNAIEYYRYYRLLRFSYSMAVLRTEILVQMNSLLKRLKYDATLTFSGIPTPQDYLSAMEKMEQRKLSFKEASELAYFSL
jgi:hypothetical protein